MKTIVCYGDSNTWGLKPYNHLAEAPERFAKPERWPTVLSEHLGAGVDVIAEGLSGRTTVFDDVIEGVFRNGSRGILCAVETHSPIDLLIIMLGTNDFKTQFGHTAYVSARGMLTLIELVQGHFVHSGGAPEILIVTPAMASEAAEVEMWGDVTQRSTNHAAYLSQVAERTGCFHFDANEVAEVGKDGVHLSKESHASLGKALAGRAKEILGMTKRSFK
ncbi:MAG: arylesterase [Roseitalea sp.]|nr:arylesterase [Roseitalea sp.]MBO6721115.1 arylesterase [Roseitalea sp.]MBO6744173.1 arylesterase [Roseitalea sp.]